MELHLTPSSAAELAATHYPLGIFGAEHKPHLPGAVPGGGGSTAHVEEGMIIASLVGTLRSRLALLNHSLVASHCENQINRIRECILTSALPSSADSTSRFPPLLDCLNFLYKKNPYFLDLLTYFPPYSV